MPVCERTTLDIGLCCVSGPTWFPSALICPFRILGVPLISGLVSDSFAVVPSPCDCVESFIMMDSPRDFHTEAESVQKYLLCSEFVLATTSTDGSKHANTSIPPSLCPCCSTLISVPLLLNLHLTRRPCTAPTP